MSYTEHLVWTDGQPGPDVRLSGIPQVGCPIEERIDLETLSIAMSERIERIFGPVLRQLFEK